MEKDHNLTITTIRMLGITAVNRANSGHPGIVLGAAPLIYNIFKHHLQADPAEPLWINRDRFVLSAGHGSALLYAMLHVAGYDLTIADLKQFRQLGSLTPGHPELDQKYGIEVTTGPLGQGIANGVGLAIAERYLSYTYNKPDFDLFDNHTFVLCGDGDLQEGVALEAISLAGRLKLQKLVVLFDSNDIQLDKATKYAQNTDFKQFMTANHWDYFFVEDGNDEATLTATIAQAKASDQPAFIEVKTIIGLGATKQGTSSVHGAPLGKDIDHVYDYYDWHHDEFTVPSDAYADLAGSLQKRGQAKRLGWEKMLANYKQQYPELAKLFVQGMNHDFSFDLKAFDADQPTTAEATRNSSGHILNKLQQFNINILGGSADLTASTKAQGINGEFGFSRSGRNINYGVREFSMVAINNGIAAYGMLLPFGGTFFAFLDYCKPALRLAALSQLQNWIVFTHDSVFLGEDGPTHQPIEQLAILRAQPHLLTFRPADFNETLGSYYAASKHSTTPAAFVLSRQNVPQLEYSQVEAVQHGAYTIFATGDNPTFIITATGSEVSLAIQTAELIHQKTHQDVRVISMVCAELFAMQSISYQKKLYSKHSHTVTLEAATTFGWSKYGTLNIGIDSFGWSGSEEQIRTHLGFTPALLAEKIIGAFASEN